MPSGAGDRERKTPACSAEEARHDRIFTFPLRPTVVGMLSGVLDDAWRELVSNRDPRVLDRTLTREHVAKRIMQSAMLGERSPNRLKAEAMAKAA